MGPDHFFLAETQLESKAVHSGSQWSVSRQACSLQTTNPLQRHAITWPEGSQRRVKAVVTR